jgi:hypothetical protein
MGHKWRVDRDGYVVGNVFDVERRKSTRLALHRVVARAPSDVLVDHVFGRLLDCRRSVLRWAIHSDNSANRRADCTGRSSKYRGVTFHKKSGKWQAQCKHRDRNYYLGLFEFEADAAEAYNRKARELFRRFANVNRLPRERATAA